MLSPKDFQKNFNRAQTELSHVIAPLSNNEEEFNFLCVELAGSFFSERYEYADNLRIARLDRPDTVLMYMSARMKGCCGSYDTVVFRDGVGFLIGFNYGH